MSWRLERGAEQATFEVRSITVGSQRFRVAIRRASQRRGRPLLLCNGLGASLEQFEPLVAALDGIETVAFDAPGVGGSPTPILPYRFRNLARALCGLLDKLGYGEVDVLGVSWGGGLAQQFAIQYPDRCRKLILVATAPGVLMVPGKLSVLRKLLTPRRYIDPAYRAQIAPEVYGGDYRKNPDLARAHVRQSRQPNWIGYWYQLFATSGWTSLPWLPFLRQPTLVLAGTDDPLVPVVNARILARLIPRARLRLVGCGHMLLLTRVHEAAAAIQQFLAGDELRQPPGHWCLGNRQPPGRRARACAVGSPCGSRTSYARFDGRWARGRLVVSPPFVHPGN